MFRPNRVFIRLTKPWKKGSSINVCCFYNRIFVLDCYTDSPLSVPNASLVNPISYDGSIVFLRSILILFPPATLNRGVFPYSYSRTYITYTPVTSPKMRWRRWLRHCATSRKVAGSIPFYVIGIFQWHNPSCRTMALGLTQPITEMSARNISWV